MKSDSKLLFWIDSFLLHYCLAHFIQKNSKHELSTIIDVPNNLKLFFETQNLVNFKNKWFYHDYIDSKKDPDLPYLQTFEKNYGINLWNMAINERIFYKYNDFYKFKQNEILSILESECKLFEKILDENKPDFLLTLDFGLHHSNLLTKMCKKRGINVLSISISKFPSSCYLSESVDTMMEEHIAGDDNFSFEDLQKLLNQNNLSKSLENLYSNIRKSKRTRFSAGFSVLSEKNKNIHTHYTYYGRTKLKLISLEIQHFIRTRSRGNFLSKNSQKTINDENFIYLPLHQEPERSLLIDAPFYTNQIELIRHIAKSIPINYVLYVKEHPTQGKARGWRDISEYKQILEIPNVRLIHPSVSSHDLIKKSDLVITVSGTASFEALIYNKPSILFANYGYHKAGIVKINCLEDLPNAISNALNSSVDLSKLSTYVSSLIKNSFDFDYYGFQTRSGNEFFYNENIVDVDIKEQKMEQYLKKEKHVFDAITNAHLKYIEKST
jgi:capsule polysaccharide modification protein KpsS